MWRRRGDRFAVQLEISRSKAAGVGKAIDGERQTRQNLVVHDVFVEDAIRIERSGVEYDAVVECRVLTDGTGLLNVKLAL